MWKQYRRMFWYTQLGIVAVCAFVVLFLKVPLLALWAYILVMEAFSVFGAWWNNRLRKKINAAFDRKEYDLRRR